MIKAKKKKKTHGSLVRWYNKKSASELLENIKILNSCMAPNDDVESDDTGIVKITLGKPQYMQLICAVSILHIFKSHISKLKISIPQKTSVRALKYTNCVVKQK